MIKIRNSIILSIIVISIFTLGCFDEYQKVVNDKQLDYMYEQIVTITTDYEFRFGEATTKEETQKATGFKYGDYIIALKHAVIPPEYIRIRSPIGMLYKPMFVTKSDYYHDGNKLYVLGYSKDIILLSHKEKPAVIDFAELIPTDYEELLYIGTKVFMIGFTHNITNNLVIGHIAQHYEIDENTKIREMPAEDIEKRLLLISAPVNHGDSGSPVYVYNRISRASKLIGILGLKNTDGGIGYLYRIDDVSTTLNEIINDYYYSLYQEIN